MNKIPKINIFRYQKLVQKHRWRKHSINRNIFLRISINIPYIVAHKFSVKSWCFSKFPFFVCVKMAPNFTPHLNTRWRQQTNYLGINLYDDDFFYHIVFKIFLPLIYANSFRWLCLKQRKIETESSWLLQTIMIFTFSSHPLTLKNYFHHFVILSLTSSRHELSY